jgi:hypothetical protein
VPRKAQRVANQLAQKVKRGQRAVKTLVVSRKEKQPAPKKLLVQRKEILKAILVPKRAVQLMKLLVLKKATRPVKRKKLRES